MIPVKNETERKALLAVADQIKSEINVKELELLDDASAVLVKEIKPNFKTLGPRFGKEMQLVTKAIKNLTDTQIKTIEEQGKLDIIINEKNSTLERSDIEITTKDIEGWLIATGNGMTVALDITLNQSLIDEGISKGIGQSYSKPPKRCGT